MVDTDYPLAGGEDKQRLPRGKEQWEMVRGNGGNQEIATARESAIKCSSTPTPAAAAVKSFGLGHSDRHKDICAKMRL